MDRRGLSPSISFLLSVSVFFNICSPILPPSFSPRLQFLPTLSLNLCPSLSHFLAGLLSVFLTLILVKCQFQHSLSPLLWLSLTFSTSHLLFCSRTSPTTPTPVLTFLSRSHQNSALCSRFSPYRCFKGTNTCCYSLPCLALHCQRCFHFQESAVSLGESLCIILWKLLGLQRPYLSFPALIGSSFLKLSVSEFPFFLFFFFVFFWSYETFSKLIHLRFHVPYHCSCNKPPTLMLIFVSTSVDDTRRFIQDTALVLVGWNVTAFTLIFWAWSQVR